MKSKALRARLESYHNELYFYVGPKNELMDETSIYNIFDYLQSSIGEIIETNYYHEITDINKSYKKQLHDFACNLKKYYNVIIDFLDEEVYNENRAKLREYVIKVNPDLF